jgi:hypothetical protein
MTHLVVRNFRRIAMYFCYKTHFHICFPEAVGDEYNRAGRREKTLKKNLPGLTLVELVLAMTIVLIVILAAGVLLVSGFRVWRQGFLSAHKKIKQDAQAVMLTFGNIARKSNRLNYGIYKQTGESFLPALPESMSDVEVVAGDAVEFRYWDVELDTTDSHKLIDTSKTATAYALFYIDGDQLVVDYGPYPPGGVPTGGGPRNTVDIETVVLADNVSTDSEGFFSHTVDGGFGKGCVRINILLTDPDDDEQIRIITGSMMRNIWPR